MIDHVSIGVSDLKSSADFYRLVLAPLDYEIRDERAATVSFGRRGKPHAEFWLNARPGMAPVPADTGTHVCMRATGQKAVDAFHAIALKLGGSDSGAPGIRPGYGDAGKDAYAAFIRDRDGNKIEVVTFV